MFGSATPVGADGQIPTYQSVIITRIVAPQGASMGYTREQVRRIEDAVYPVVDRGDAYVVMSNLAPGFQRPAPVNEAMVFIRLKPWNERTIKQQQITEELQTLKEELLKRPARAAGGRNRPARGASLTVASPVAELASDDRAEPTDKAAPLNSDHPADAEADTAPPSGNTDADIHALLSQRIAAMQEERQNRWQKILGFFATKPQQPVP